MAPARAILIALGAWWLVPAGSVAAQVQRAARPEFRVDALASHAPSLQAGLGVAFPVATYVRLAAIAGAGVARWRGSTGGAGRAEVVMRFLLDPYGEARLGFYGVGGLMVRYDAFDRWRPDAVVGLGLEGRFRAPLTPAVEIGLGGGVRAGVSLRWTRGDVR
ncbi:MAG: hypothetical protein U0132_15275 [Gemmatimonadaceae bacterium]